MLGRGDRVEERFHILVGTSCNNNCVFCMEPREGPGSFGAGSATPDRVRRELEAHAGADEVMFASGEPTLNPAFPTFVRWARELGYGRIGLTTNARRLGYEEYARRLLESGLNHIVVSVHGPDAGTHDAQTRTPNSFQQTLAALRTIARLRREHPFTLHSSTVVGRRNHTRLGEILALLREFDVDQYVFNVMQPLGRAQPIVHLLMARYGDVVDEFARCVEAVPAPRPEMYLVDLPPCTTERLPPEVRGYVEAAFFTAYDADGAPELRRTREHKEAPNREKRAECAGCRYDAACLGVWRAYARVHGWEEFVPVATGAALDPRAPGARELRRR
jgi:MoaA/NifB/PqqE/SkfB family radical SAM enzyme